MSDVSVALILSASESAAAPASPMLSFFAECAAMLAFGDELLVLPNDEHEWRTPGGRDLAAVYLLPRAETALRQELQRLADAVARQGRRHRAGRARLTRATSASR